MTMYAATEVTAATVAAEASQSMSSPDSVGGSIMDTTEDYCADDSKDFSIRDTFKAEGLPEHL